MSSSYSTTRQTSVRPTQLAAHVASQTFLDRPALSARRINDHVAEPASQGNVFMDIMGGTGSGDVGERREAHKERVSEELRKIERLLRM